MGNCNECKWISITEQEQVDKRIDHICLKHKVRVFHRSNNPKMKHDYIFPCLICSGADFEKR